MCLKGRKENPVTTDKTELEIYAKPVSASANQIEGL